MCCSFVTYNVIWFEAGTTTQDGLFSSDLVSTLQRKLEAVVRRAPNQDKVELTEIFTWVAQRINGQAQFMQGRPQFTIQIDGTVGEIEF